MNLYKGKTRKIALAIMMLSMILPAAFVQAAMQSAHYVIYENVMHDFEGPQISGVSYTVAGTDVTVTWTTNVLSDSFVVYDTNSSFSASKEQGTSVKNYTSHSVTLTGLDPVTPYYFKAKSTRVNGGFNESSSGSFTTGGTAPTPTPTPTPVTPVSAGGGMLIIDKTDKAAPIVTDVSFKLLKDKVEISWKTNENSNSFVEYGETEKYGSTFGEWNSATEHLVSLENLLPATPYHFRALSSDGWGNVGYSADMTFTTLTSTGEEVKPGEKPIDQKVLEEVTRRTLEFMKKLFPEVSLNQLGPNPYSSITSLDQILKFIPAPVMSGLPSIEAGATDATVKWTTDVDANGVVALAPEDKYNSQAAEPYIQIVGDPDLYTKNHEVNIIGLAPNTTYHIQLRSRAKLGPTAKSKDFNFKTSAEELQITSYFSQAIDQQTVAFKWVTNKNADSVVKIAPYLNNILAVDQSKTFKDNNQSVIHDLKVSEFSSGLIYEVELSSTDEKGNTVTKTLTNFSTGKDDVPPEITRIKAESTVFLDKKDKTQTVISWTTNEPATSKIYYQEGVFGSSVKLNESTVLSDNYNKEHIIVITKFKPGTVYTFRVESTDASGNNTLSQPHTFMTAKQKESIIQVITRVLENTFGWVKKIGA